MTVSTREELSTSILKVLSVIVVIFLAPIWASYVLSILWGWFITPVFGLIAPRLPYIYGLILVVRMLTGYRGSNSKEVDHPYAKMFGNLFLVPLSVLFIGWVTTLFI